MDENMNAENTNTETEGDSLFNASGAEAYAAPAVDPAVAQAFVAAEAAEVQEGDAELRPTSESLAVGIAESFESGPATSAAPVEDGEVTEKGISIITREATVLGDIITDGHIDIVGKVRGNIAAQGDVAIHGTVRGDIAGEKIGMYNCRVKGDLKAGQGVIVDDNSIIDGNVVTKNIIFDGKVKGNIAADSVVVLRSHSYLLGDVTAASIAVEPGAILNGTVRTLVEGDLEAPFEEVL